jgi:hypothetical protein
MGLRGLFGKMRGAKQQAAPQLTEAEREEFAALLTAYGAHLESMATYLKPISGLPALLPSALNADNRAAIGGLIEQQLPAMRSALTELRGATPPPFLHAIHQNVVDGLSRTVSGAEQVQSSVRLEAGSAASSAYATGRDVLNTGVALTAEAQKAMNVKVGEAVRRLQDAAS